MINLTVLAIGKLTKRFLKGAIIDVAKIFVAKPIIAAKEAVKDVIVENVESTDGGEGKIDYTRIAGTIFTFALVMLYVLGYITEEQLLKFVTFF
jgi:hypothetical protein